VLRYSSSEEIVLLWLSSGLDSGVGNTLTEDNKLKTEVKRFVDLHRQELVELSLKIHANPELGFKEERASGWLISYLEKNGFRVEGSVGNLPTAFKATYGSGNPVIAFLAEYDALPEIGHACGHNIIAASAVGAGIASKSVVDNHGGTIMVIGTPAEEIFGGKLTMLKNRVFEGVDVAMIVHPGVRNMVTVEALACVTIIVEFYGKAAHAAANPEQGINALEAMILSFNAINSLRQHMKDRARIHGIITHGGEAANIIPAYTRAEVMVRATETDYLDELKEKVLNCFTGASIATGARLEYKWSEDYYAPMNNNLTMARLFSKNMESLGRKVEPFEHRFGFGSTDMGNVSQVVPSIHPEVAIASTGTLLHSEDFAKAAASEAAHDGIIASAKAQAMTVVDILSEKDVLVKIKEEFLSSPKMK
jgi:amidohydrolase